MQMAMTRMTTTKNIDVGDDDDNLDDNERGYDNTDNEKGDGNPWISNLARVRRI